MNRKGPETGGSDSFRDDDRPEELGDFSLAKRESSSDLIRLRGLVERDQMEMATMWIGVAGLDEEEYFKEYENGDFTDREERIETPVEGVTLLRDIGLTFYKVKSGDTISGIRRKLTALPEFAYVAELTTYKLQSFNIPPKSLQIDMWLPIPLPPEQRILTDAEFTGHCREGIQEMRTHEVYGEKVSQLLDSGKVTESELLAIVVVI